MVIKFPKFFDFSAVNKKDFTLFELPMNGVEMPFIRTWAYLYRDERTKTELILVTHVRIERELYPSIATLAFVMDDNGVHRPIYVTVIPIDRVSQLLKGVSKRTYRRGYYRGKRNATVARRILKQIAPNVKIRSKRSKYPIKRKSLTATTKLSEIAKKAA
jgi:hypothetical protein